jgi:predicted O-methyltransferase YrrM
VPGATADYPDFAQAWSRAGEIPGWLTRAQGEQLWRAARDLLAGGVIVEIGSHQGRSTVILAAAAQRDDAGVVAIDPFVDGRMFGGSATRRKFEANIAAARLGDVVRLIAEPSTAIRPGWDEPISLLYIDGKHDYWTVSDDLRWTEHVVAGGHVLVHDAFSSIGVTLGLARHVLPGRSLRYVGRTGSLARFEACRPHKRDRVRMLGELPWWLHNVAIKIVLRVGRLFGHHTTPDPY